MKIDENIILTLKDILSDPEKDWSNQLPFIQLTDTDFDTGRRLINKYVTDKARKDYVLERLDQFNCQWDEGLKVWYKEPHEEFIYFLKKEIGYRKNWKNKEKIEAEIEKTFEFKRFEAIDEKVFQKFNQMLSNLSNSRGYRKWFNETHKELCENFDFDKATQLLEAKTND